jgi:predicted membrane protein
MVKTNNAINISDSGIPVYNGAGIFYSNTTTQYSVLVGGVATSPIVSVGAAATSGVPLISQGASANPAFGTAVVAGGGTGRASASIYAPICGGTTTTGAYQSAYTGLSFTGYVLVSNGPSAVPSFTAIANSVTGTANQVLVNGTSGSPKTGALTFTTPQDIALTSNVQFGKVGVNIPASNNYLSVNGSACIGAGDTAAPTDGLLVSGQAGFGNSNVLSYHYIWGRSWTVHDHVIALQGPLVGQNNATEKSGIFINPTLAPSYTVGPVFFMAGQTITPKFAPEAGCIISDAYALNLRYGEQFTTTTGVVTRGTTLWVGKALYGNSRYTAYFDPLVGIGETTPSSALHCSTSSFTASNSQYTFEGSHVGLNSDDNKYSLEVSPTLAPTYRGTLDVVAGEFIGPTFSPAASCTITNAYGMYIGIGVESGAGAITNGYGLYVSNPAFGSNQYTARFASGVGINCAAKNNALSVDGSVCIGSADTAAPTDGLRVEGLLYAANQLGVGIGATLLGKVDFNANSFEDANILLYMHGTLIGVDNSSLKSSLYMNVSIAPPPGVITTCSGITVGPVFAAASCTITTAYGIHIAGGSGTRTGSGTITTGYGLYVTNPSYGKSQYTARLDAGVSIGNGDPVASAALRVVSTSQGFQPPVMTSLNRTNIASPAEGLMVYDTTLNAICFWNGAAWRTVAGT